MSDANKRMVILHLRKIALGGGRGRLLRDTVRMDLVNQTLRSRDLAPPPLQLSGKMDDTVPVLEIPANPHGLYQLHVTPERYRRKSIFLNVNPGRRPMRVELLDFFIRADQAVPDFPSFRVLQGDAWTDLAGVLQASGIGELQYKGLSDKQTGTLFNIHAKTQSEKLSKKASVFSFFKKIVRIQEERVFVRVKSELLPLLKDRKSGFRVAPGTLHRGFTDGFVRIDEEGSFKTRESMGNLQLTFARNPADPSELEVDADLDDNQGIRHAFDVLHHTFTGEKTHPFDIHQVLLRFHGIDPGYTLS